MSESDKLFQGDLPPRNSTQFTPEEVNTFLDSYSAKLLNITTITEARILMAKLEKMANQEINESA
jgi:hypothetical protein